REKGAHEPLFVGLLGDSNFEVRLTAVQFFGKRGEPQFANALLPRLSDKDSDVRLAAAKALGAIGNSESIEALVVALTDEEKAVREAAESALGKIDSNWTGCEGAQRAISRLEASLAE